MIQGRFIARGVCVSLVGLLMLIASAPALWSAPPLHANNNKSTDSTDLSKPTRGRGWKSSNTAPTISGIPATSVLQNYSYGFEPTADDADGDALIFSITNLPRWASFDAVSGRLVGTPGSGDIGLYSGIVIAVSDGQASAELPSFDIEVLSYANGTATLSWAAPTENSDGSPLLDLAGYRIYWGSESGSYSDSLEISNPGITAYVVENLTTGTHYFALTAINAQGVESTLSNEAIKTIAP